MDPLFSSFSHTLGIKKGYSVQSYVIFWVTFIVASKNNKSGILFVLVSCPNETLRWHHKVDPFSCVVTHGPREPQLPYFERVQHLKEKSRAKNFFMIVTWVIAKVY